MKTPLKQQKKAVSEVFLICISIVISIRLNLLMYKPCYPHLQGFATACCTASASFPLRMTEPSRRVIPISLARANT